MTETKASGKGNYIVIGVVIVAALLLVPFPTQLSPDFTVKFMDDAGNPIRGMEVLRTCTHYTYYPIGSVCPEDWDNPRRTDDEGSVSFTANYVWYGAASRVVRTVFSYMMLIAHGSVGRSITLFPRAPAGIKSSMWINIDPDNPQKEVVLERESEVEQK
ncbi:MAG: hypothetical protein AB7F88_02395 [Pyrinomonadaceae bacterium]